MGQGGTGHKAGGHDKIGKKTTFSFLLELLLENITVNERGAFGIPPHNGDRGQYSVYTLSFYK